MGFAIFYTFLIVTIAKKENVSVSVQNITLTKPPGLMTELPQKYFLREQRKEQM